MRLDLSKVNDVEQLSGGRPEPGTYHMVIDGVDASFEEVVNAVVVDFRVLAGTTPGMEGRLHRERFYASDKAMPRLQRLAILCGLIRPGEHKDVSFPDAVGAELIVTLEAEEYEKNGEKRTAVKIPWMGFYSVANPEYKHVPRGNTGGTPKRSWRDNYPEAQQAGEKKPSHTTFTATDDYDDL